MDDRARKFLEDVFTPARRGTNPECKTWCGSMLPTSRDRVEVDVHGNLLVCRNPEALSRNRWPAAAIRLG